MSFSVTCIGKPEAIKRKLAEESERLMGQSREEFDAVRPALDTILDQNVGNGVVRLDVNGHATFSSGDNPDGVSPGRSKTYGTCTVNVSVLGQLAE